MGERTVDSDGWPEFTIPDVGAPGAGEETPAGDTSGSRPAANDQAAKPDAERQPVVGADGEMIPKYRLDEVTQRNAELQQQLERVLRVLEANRPAPKEDDEPDPEQLRKQKIVNDLLELDPRIRKAIELGEKADVIQALLQTSQEREAMEKASWDDFANRQLAKVHDGFAAALSGGKRKGAELPQETRQGLTDNFIAWVMQDGSGRRAGRYNAKDETLPTEFIQSFMKQYVDPLRRTTAAATVTAARRVQNLPVGGGSSSPLGTPKPKPNDDDEDAIFKRGWEDTKQRMEQQS